MKRDSRDLYRLIKSKPESKMFQQLLELLDNLSYETLESMVSTVDTDELLRLQGQARSLKILRSNLTRKPVDNPLNGAGR